MPERKTILRVLTAILVLAVSVGGVFFIFAPYQASRIRADISDRIFARGGEPLVLATAAEDGAYFALGNDLRLHLDAARSYQIEVQATPGSMDNLRMLEDGSADLALIQGGLAATRASVTGGGLIGEEDKLVALANLGREYVHVVVPADSQIRTFRDLAGKRVGVGSSGGGAEALAQKVMRFYRFSNEATLVVDHNPLLSDAFLDGEIDAAFTVYGLFAPAMDNLLATGWYRLVPIPEAEAVSQYVPGAFAETLNYYLYGPDRTMPSPENGPFQTLAVNRLLVCQSDLPERQVYTVLEEIFSGPFLKMARLTDLNEESAQQALHLPLHRAAEAFYNRRNPVSSDRFEILSFFLAGVVCLASVIHFLMAHRKSINQAQRRVAIRPYFEAMMDFGDAVENAGSASNLTCLIHKIMATQRGAERKWLEGEFDTEDMENLYAVYSLRCDNAFNKIFALQLQGMQRINVIDHSAEPSHGSWPAEEAAHEESPWRPSARAELPTWAARDDEEEEEVLSMPTPTYDDEFDDHFSGAPLAGIDHTKKDIAASLPNRYDSGLLYDTEASGAGAVRVRKARPSAELQATAPEEVDEAPQEVPQELPREVPTVNRDVPYPARAVVNQGVPERREHAEAVLSPEPPKDDPHDQMMLF